MSEFDKFLKRFKKKFNISSSDISEINKEEKTIRLKYDVDLENFFQYRIIYFISEEKQKVYMFNKGNLTIYVFSPRE